LFEIKFMQIFLKTLRGDKLELQIDPSMTVAEVKQLIASQHGHDPALQKLISSGKILEDQKAISEYSINDGDTLVIMVSKPKPSAQVQPARPAPQPSVGTSSRPSQPSGPSSENAGTLVTGEAYEEAVTRIVDMGFERSQVQRAMRAAFNNPDRAIEYLFSGIPEDPHPAVPSGSHHGHSPVSSPGHSGVVSDNPLAFLLSNPMFLQLRTMIQQNPSILPQLLQQLQQSNPQLLTLISQNQDAFMSLINDPLPEGAAPQIDRKD
jgi:UV excision repair protein RAD23